MATTVIDELITILGFKVQSDDLKKLDRQLRDVDRSVKQTMDRFAKGAAILGTALTGISFTVGRTVLSFDRAMNTLQATFLDEPASQIETLRLQAQQLGAETSKSATDVANAQVELARAGLDVKQVLQAVPHVLDLAIAGELEMGEAAGLVTNQLAAFGLETTETGRVVDVLTRTAVSARTTVAELGPAFRQVAPLAAELGIQIEQTAAIIGTLRSGGLIPEQAGTAFRNIIAVLQEDPTDKIREGFQKLGLDFEAVRAMVSGGDIEGAFKRLGAAGLDTQTALQIFGRESAVGASILAGSASDIDDFIAKLEDAGGTAADMRAIIESGLPGSTDQLKSSIEGIQLALGDAGLRGAMIWAIDKIRDFINWLSNSGAWVKTTAAIALAAGPVLLVLAAAAKALTFALGGVTVAGRILHGVINLLTPAWWRATAAKVASTTASIAETVALWAMIAADRVAIIHRRISAVATRIATAVNRAFTASLVGQRIAMVAGVATTGIATAATWAFNSALGRIATTVWTSSVAALRGLWTRLTMASTAMLRFAGRAIVSGIAGVAAFAASIWTGAVPALTAFAAGIWATTAALLANPITWIVLAVAGLIAALVLLVMHWDTVKCTVLDVWSSVVDTVQGAWNAVVGIFRDHWDKILAIIFPAVGLPILIARNWGRIVEVVGDIWARVTDTVRGWIDAILAFLVGLPGRVLAVLKAIPDMVADAIRDIPGLGVTLDVVGRAANQATRLVGLAQGGIVTRPTLGLLGEGDGPEAVIPLDRLRAMLGGDGAQAMGRFFTAPPVPLPVAPAGVGAAGSSTVVNRNTSVEISGPIHVNTQATNAREIAQSISQEIDDQVRNIAFEFDSGER